ncbi:cache domain-containing protein [Nereida sp. MMG025]|uniref:cache domain-containing protein n=1 Tax=Nereida sp. MMG025 TaxID=2909981 RepID=UPI001F27868E|nr:cache domain-containing protein [Nereida sp. MMG025]MCF6443573.1 cache domain-containing protein [Nereida sp. MMG025]
MRKRSSPIRLSYGQKLFFLATLPLVVAATIIGWVVLDQSRELAEREIAALETQLLAAKKEELKNYLSIARTGFVNIYGRAAPDDAVAKEEVRQLLSAMLYGQDGYFFVFDYDGTNLVAPRQTFLIDKDWSGLTDINDVPITDQLIDIARSGGGYHSFEWTKPSTGKKAPFITYVAGLQDWRWAVGTGIFVDDVQATVAAARADVERRIDRTFVYIVAITLGALMVVFVSGLVLNIRERRLADAKLKQLTERIFDTQEEERGRVARELHDGISQILVGIRYSLELAKRRFAKGDTGAGDSLNRGIESLNEAIGEVRRISRDLRPGVLDDLGLGPALKSLTDEFSDRTGLATDFETVVFRNRLDQDAKIALYRIAQEALTNIERHADATRVRMDLKGHRNGATLRISDNGRGLPQQNDDGPSGLGLRNMAERIEQLDGTLRILSSKSGTVIEAQVPLTHLLPPETPTKASA